MDTVQLDQAIETLQNNKDRWVKLPIQRKVQLVDELLHNTNKVSASMVNRALQAKEIDATSPRAAEEWLGGPLITARNLRLLRKSLEEIAHDGVPYLPDSRIRSRADGQVVADVFPNDIFDRLLYTGFRAEIWMQPQVKRDALRKTMGVFYQGETKEGKVALVLGAGNVASIGPLDVIYKLFVEGQVCILKLNPVNDYLGSFIERWFAPLIDQGFLQMAYGGGDVGAYLCQHDSIDEIHITGSEYTHDIIVYGPGEEGKTRKKNNEPILQKRITSELGNVSPVIVVPGQWSDAELQFQAENVATQMTNNAGFNCNAAKVLITHKAWAQRETFLDKLRATLRSLPPRSAYYPGAHDRHQTFTEAHPEAELLGPKDNRIVPWTLIPNVDANNKDDIVFNQESFCSVTAETPIEAADAADFLRKATAFCNDTLHGTLNACILIHPNTEKRMHAALDEAISNLRYGSIGINHWPALSYGLGATTWGAYPGHTLDDIQSGIGVVHNTFMFEYPEKSVIYGPFVVKPRPPWFVTHRMSHKLAPKLVAFETSPRWAALPGIVFHAVRG